ncbi:MAG: cobalamin-dependent protein [Nanoarchaeota archaeon]|nr:cobalamin-dependent protein [Nanoarchaeota archaeon]MBU1850151.1 cobalamin-dependent protein [Nanoarchaeota archaeon]
MKPKILYIHPFCNPELSDFLFLPAGILGVLNNLRSKGFSVTGLNIPLEMKLDSDINFEKLIASFDFDIIILDCHWYYFLHGVQVIAESCKKINPDCFVLVGGFSANFFRYELLKNCEAIDVVLKGDQETLLPTIFKSLISEGRKSLKKFPNIAYRNFFGFVVDKKISHFDNDINKCNYTDISFMRHWKEYMGFYLGPKAPGVNQKFENENFFYLPTQKGCIHNCPCCGGSAFSQKILSNKKGAFIRSPEKIFADFEYLNSLGVSKIMISCDSKLNDWVRILKDLEKKKIFIGILFEDWQLPSKEFAKQMISYAKKTDSGFLISALSGNENIRLKNGKKATNDELEEIAKIFADSDSYISFWFSPNIVGETFDSFQSAIDFAKELVSFNNKKKRISVQCSSMELDLTSQVYFQPKNFACKSYLWSYSDFLNHLKFRVKNTVKGNMSFESVEINVSKTNELILLFEKELSIQ